MGGTPSTSFKPVRGAVDLRKDVKLVNRATEEFSAFLSRLRSDDSSRSYSEENVRTLFVAEAKKSGLYDELKQAGIERLKYSGTYERLIIDYLAHSRVQELRQTADMLNDLVRRTGETEDLARALGTLEKLRQSAVADVHSRNFERVLNLLSDKAVTQVLLDNKIELPGRSVKDRAAAEKWIEQQFDYDRIDTDFREDEPYFELYATVLEGPWAHKSNTGTAAVYGDKSNVSVNGRFTLKFFEADNQMFYAVANRDTGKIFDPRPYDPRGTIIEVEGLRAEMFGTPAPGDTFSFNKPARFEIGYPSNRVELPLAAQKASHKEYMFDRFFAPRVGGPGTIRHSATIRNFLQAQPA